MHASASALTSASVTVLLLVLVEILRVGVPEHFVEICEVLNIIDEDIG